MAPAITVGKAVRNAEETTDIDINEELVDEDIIPNDTTNSKKRDREPEYSETPKRQEMTNKTFTITNHYHY
jgi:hypothetical protein